MRDANVGLLIVRADIHVGIQVKESRDYTGYR